MIFLTNIKHVSSYVLKRTVSMRWFFFVPTTYFCSHQYLKCVWVAWMKLNGENGFPTDTLIWKPE